LRKEGRKVGLFRPVTLFPFPQKRISEVAGGVKRLMVVEMNSGQMVDDVRLAVNGKCDVAFYGRAGGVVFTPEELYKKIKTEFKRTNHKALNRA
jgi:2-oxoglutarate ferredoxin oxidoreductase subunit alpha